MRLGQLIEKLKGLQEVGIPDDALIILGHAKYKERFGIALMQAELETDTDECAHIYFHLAQSYEEAKEIVERAREMTANHDNVYHETLKPYKVKSD